MAQERCAVPDCGGYRAQISPAGQDETDSSRLCAVCYDRFAGCIATLSILYAQCEELLVARRVRGFERIRGGRPGGVNLNDAAVAARSDLLTVAASWCGLIVDQRSVPARPRRDIVELSTFLRTHLRWLVAHPAITDAFDEITAVVRAAQDVVDGDQSLCRELGPCGEPDCASRVYATSGTSTSPQVRCDQGHLWQPKDWLRLHAWPAQR